MLTSNDAPTAYATQVLPTQAQVSPSDMNVRLRAAAVIVMLLGALVGALTILARRKVVKKL